MISPDIFIDLFRDSIKTVLLLISVIILPGLFVGVLVSVFQAATQINEQTLSFMPRLMVTFCVLAVGASWFYERMSSFTFNITSRILEYLH